MDFHARQYDPQLGRFLSIDPLAYSGGQQVFSPYAAMGNSPGMMIDPNGEMTMYAEDLTAAENDWLMNSPGRMAWNLGRNTDRNGASRMLGHNMGGDMMMLMYAGGGGSFRIDRDGSMSGTGAGARIMFELYLKYSKDLSQRYVPSNDDLTDLEYSDDMLPGLQVSARSGKWMPANLDEVASAIQRSLSGIQSSGSGGWLSGLQMGLDILGSTEIPIVSQLSDLGSGLISGFQGDYKGALLSLGGIIIPGLSQAKLAGKIAKRASSVVEQATAISKQIGKNSVNIRTPNRTLHFDLQGATHKGVPTPHIQQSLPNVNPKTGEVFWNKDRQWIEPMTQQDIRTIRNYLKRR